MKFQISVTVVDIDPVMKRVAEKWYDFKESPHHQIVVEDGVTFVHEAAVKGFFFSATPHIITIANTNYVQ